MDGDMSFDYNLFLEAKNDCNNATTSLSLLDSLVTRLQSSPLPKCVQTSTISGIVTNCKGLKDMGPNIQSVFDGFEGAIAACGAAENRFNDVSLELDSLEQQISDFISRPVGGRVTLEQGIAMQEEIADLYERKRKLEDESNYLKDLLGIETVEEEKWYDVLQDVTDEFTSDCKDLAALYKEAFDKTGAEDNSTDVTNAVMGTAELYIKIDATKAQIQSDLLRGLGNIGEKITDFFVQTAGALAASGYQNPGQYSSYAMYSQLNNLGQYQGTGNIPYSDYGKVQSDIIKAQTQAVVTEDTVDTWYKNYYEKTDKGQNVNEYSYIKYDDALAEGISDVTETVGETAAIVGLSLIGGPAGALAAATFSGMTTGGDAVNKAYDNGATFDEATTYMAMVGGANALLTYAGSSHFSKLVTGTQALGIIPTVKRVGLDVTTAGLVPAVDTVAEWMTWGSEYHTTQDLKEIWQKNNTTESMLMNAGIAFALSAGAEGVESLARGRGKKPQTIDAPKIADSPSTPKYDESNYTPIKEQSIDIEALGKKAINDIDVAKKDAFEFFDNRGKAAGEILDPFYVWEGKLINNVGFEDVYEYIAKKFPEAAGKYTYNKSAAKKLADLLGFEDHGFLHVFRVADRVSASYDSLSKSLKNLNINGYSTINNNQIKLMNEIEGIFHDTGMATNYTLGVDKKTRQLQSLLEDYMGFQTRAQHPWRSAFEVLENAESFNIPADKKEFIATVLASHSKSNSGLQHIGSYSEMSNLVDILYKGSKVDLSAAGNRYTFDLSNMVKTYPDGSPIMKTITENGVLKEVYDFKPGVIEQLRSDAASLRIGDSIANKTGFNQAGGNIVVDKSAGNGIVFDQNNSHKTLDALCEEESAASEIKVVYSDGTQSYLNKSDNPGYSISKTIIMGEKNCPGVDIRVDSTGKMVYTFKVNTTDAPASTVKYGIGEKFGEIASITEASDGTAIGYKTVPQEIVIELPADADQSLIDFYKNQSKEYLDARLGELNISNPNDITIKVITN